MLADRAVLNRLTAETWSLGESQARRSATAGAQAGTQPPVHRQPHRHLHWLHLFIVWRHAFAECECLGICDIQSVTDMSGHSPPTCSRSRFTTQGQVPLTFPWAGRA